MEEKARRIVEAMRNARKRVRENRSAALTDFRQFYSCLTDTLPGQQFRNELHVIKSACDSGCYQEMEKACQQDDKKKADCIRRNAKILEDKYIQSEIAWGVLGWFAEALDWNPVTYARQPVQSAAQTPPVQRSPAWSVGPSAQSPSVQPAQTPTPRTTAMTSRSDSVVSFVKRVLSVVFAFICWIAGLGTVLLGILYFIISELPTAVPLVIAGIIILPPITRRFFNTKKRRGFVTWAFFLLWIASMVIYSSGVARSVLNNDRNHAGETAQHEEPVPQSGQEVSQDVEADSVDEQDVLPDIQDVLPDSESVPLAAETETVPDFSGRWYDTNLNVMLAAQDGVSLSFQIYQSDKDAPYASFSGILKNGVVSYEDGKNLRNVPADISIAESGVVNMSEDEIQWTYVSRGEYRRASFYRLEALPSTAAKKPQYLFPSDSQYITRQDLDRLNREQVSLVRNEIYARYGYTFETESVAKYFLEQSWYTPDANVNAGSLDIENMNAYERANIETILQYEIEKGWRSASGSQTGSSRSEAQPPVEDPYLFPTDKKYITKQDLKGLTQKQVSLIRNEIYARYGYNFVDPEIRDYFKGKSWYRARPGVNANTFGEEDMTPVERTNLETIISYERDMKWRS